MNYSYQTALALLHRPEILFSACSCVCSQLWSLVDSDLQFSQWRQILQEAQAANSLIFIHNKPFLESLILHHSFLPNTPPEPGTTPACFKLKETKQQKYLVKDTTFFRWFPRIKSSLKMNCHYIWKLLLDRVCDNETLPGTAQLHSQGSSACSFVLKPIL